jgi:hypothetical protein
VSDQQRDPEEARALFRYSVIAEAINPRLSPAERGRIARELAGRAWVTPEGTERSYSRTTIDRWTAAYAKDGLAGLRRPPRTDKGNPRRQGDWLAEAAKLRRAVPARSSAQIVDIIARRTGSSFPSAPCASTCAGPACPVRRWRPPRRVLTAVSRPPAPTRSG